MNTKLRCFWCCSTETTVHFTVWCLEVSDDSFASGFGRLDWFIDLQIGVKFWLQFEIWLQFWLQFEMTSSFRLDISWCECILFLLAHVSLWFLIDYKSQSASAYKLNEWSYIRSDWLMLANTSKTHRDMGLSTVEEHIWRTRDYSSQDWWCHDKSSSLYSTTRHTGHQRSCSLRALSCKLTYEPE